MGFPSHGTARAGHDPEMTGHDQRNAHLEDAALLLGALLLFACLASVMLVTRNVDWGKRLA